MTGEKRPWTKDDVVIGTLVPLGFTAFLVWPVFVFSPSFSFS